MDLGPRKPFITAFETIVDGERSWICALCRGVLDARFTTDNYGYPVHYFVHIRTADKERCDFMKQLTEGARS